MRNSTKNLKATTKTQLMKKQITIFGSAILLVAGVTLTASTQQEKGNKDKKEQHQSQGKPGANPGKANKETQGNKNPKNDKVQGQPSGKGNQGKNEDKFNRGMNEKNNNGKKNDDKNNKDIGDKNNRGNRDNHDVAGYNWTRETFRDREKLRKQEKVTICHKFNNDGEPPVSIRVSANALKAHMSHGDVMGDCPPITDRRFSDIFLRNRTDYYNNILNTQDQVHYSRSVLDYALARLTNSRLQLATMQNNNLPLQDIQRKQATVVELEQNVSLLETVLGVAANLIANKLQ